GIVFYSFQGLTGSISYSSTTLGDYKVELDRLRAEQSQLERLTQPFYVNVTPESIENAKYTLEIAVESIEQKISALKGQNFDLVNDLQVIGTSKVARSSPLTGAEVNLGQELDAIQQELQTNLVPTIDEIGTHALVLAEQSIAMNEIMPAVVYSFGDLEAIRKRLIFQYRIKTNLSNTKPEWLKFLAAIGGGEKGFNESASSDENLFFQFRSQIGELTAIQTKEESEATSSWAKTKLDGVRGDYSRTKIMLDAYVNKTENGPIIETLQNFDLKMRSAFKTLGMLIETRYLSEQLAMDFDVLNGKITTALDDSERTIESERKKVSEAILSDGERFLRILIGLSVVGALISLMIGLFVKRSITRPVDDLVEVAKDIAQGEGDLTKR
ncbi:uncharacterized protein METZ01_LOCUS301634, partial [marine metagenome]